MITYGTKNIKNIAPAKVKAISTIAITKQPTIDTTAANRVATSKNGKRITDSKNLNRFIIPSSFKFEKNPGQKMASLFA